MENIRQALLLDEACDYAGAEPYWQQVYQENGNYALALSGLGKAAYQRGETQQAMAYFKRANDRSNYDTAFATYRTAYIREHFVYFGVAVTALVAAALVYRHGGSPRQMAQAVARALKNMMGLVCDPVAGLVEVPCVKRNVAGAMNALSAAELALAGIESRIPTDEVIDAMRAVGEALPSALRETGRGGVAASPTAVAFRENFFGKQA